MTNLSYLQRKARLFSLAEATFSGDDFLRDIAIFQAHLQQCNHPLSAVILSEPDSYRFAVRIFALAQQGITIYIPSNAQPETLAELKEFTEFTAGSDVFPDSFHSLEASLPTSANSSLSQSHQLLWPSQGKLIFSTSGSTGKAKLIEKYWWQLNKELSCLIDTFSDATHHVNDETVENRGQQTARKINEESVFLATVPHHHIYGMLFRLLWPLKISATIERQIDYPESALSFLNNSENTVLISSPAFLKRLSKDNVFAPFAEHFTTVFSSGGKLDDNDAVTLAKQLNHGITQVYGSTESGGIAYRQVTTLPAQPWTVFNNIQVKCDEPSRQLYLNSPYLSDGTSSATDNWVLMDDIIAAISAKQFYLLGRADRTVKIEDKRVNLTDLETSLITHPWVDEARIIVKQGKRELLAAVVALTPEGKNAQVTLTKFQMNQQLKQALSAKFSSLCLPKKWRYLSELPYNPQGKLTQAALEKVFD